MINEIYVFLEGQDDVEFYEAIFSRQIKRKGILDHKIPYSNKPVRDVNRLLKAVKTWEKCEYIFFADFNSSECYQMKKARLMGSYPNLESGNIIIVKREIESWYLAGVSDRIAKDMGLFGIEDTSEITKKEFRRRLKGQKEYVIKGEILAAYNTHVAKKRNASFLYACNRINNIRISI